MERIEYQIEDRDAVIAQIEAAGKMYVNDNTTDLDEAAGRPTAFLM